MLSARHPARSSALLLFSLLLLAALSAPVHAETLLLTAPMPSICVTDPDAVFGIENGALLPARGLFSIAPLGETPLQPAVSVPAWAAPGDLVRILVVCREPIDAMAVLLEGPGRGGAPLSRGIGFRMGGSSAGDAWAALLGIPAGAAERGYTLSVLLTAGPRSAQLLQPLFVRGREFPAETIAITRALSTLRTSPDPRKAEEARSLSLLLLTPHADATLETQAFSVPLAAARRTSGYGDRRVYRYSDATVDTSIHAGVDLAAPTGTLVPACGRGRVVFAAARILTGNSVVIEHLPGLFSIYYHLSAISVKEGEVVDKGQLIGRVGMTGFATGPHLHWEVQALGIAVDPDLLARGPLLDKSLDFIDIQAAIAPKGGE
jgi:murein DD-endopeptidase MepM/ murein hydrolase activator NlpD